MQKNQAQETSDQEATTQCLQVIEEQRQIMRDCIKGRQFQRQLLVEHIEQAKLADAKMLASLDSDIANFTERLKGLDHTAEKFQQLRGAV